MYCKTKMLFKEKVRAGKVRAGYVRGNTERVSEPGESNNTRTIPSLRFPSWSPARDRRTVPMVRPHGPLARPAFYTSGRMTGMFFNDKISGKVIRHVRSAGSPAKGLPGVAERLIRYGIRHIASGIEQRFPAQKGKSLDKGFSALCGSGKEASEHAGNTGTIQHSKAVYRHSG